MSEEALASAIQLFSIQDVFLIESRLSVSRALNPQQTIGELNVQIRHGLQSQILFQERETQHGAHLLVMRRYVETGLRLVDDALQGPEIPASDDNKIGEIEAVFAADYLVKTAERPATELIEAFEENVVFHVWPYWREYLQNSLSRMRLPPIILPMFKRLRPPPEK